MLILFYALDSFLFSTTSSRGGKTGKKTYVNTFWKKGQEPKKHRKTESTWINNSTRFFSGVLLDFCKKEGEEVTNVNSVNSQSLVRLVKFACAFLRKIIPISDWIQSKFLSNRYTCIITKLRMKQCHGFLIVWKYCPLLLLQLSRHFCCKFKWTVITGRVYLKFTMNSIYFVLL